MSLADQLVRPNIKAMQSYQSARDTMSDNPDFLFLDAAENPYCPFDLEEGAARIAQNLNRYPNPQPEACKTLLAQKFHVSEEQLLMSRGSEEAIRLLIQVFCRPSQDQILLCPPTFGLYQIEAALHDVSCVTVPRIGADLNQLQTEKIIELCKDSQKNIKLIFLCNPGNPASTPLDPVQITQLLDALSEECLIVVDEAYIDFCPQTSFAAKLHEYPNLIVLRTLSKSYGLAGLRIGATLANPDILTYLDRMMAIYPFARSTATLIEESLSPKRQEFMEQNRQDLLEERTRLLEAFKKISFVSKVFPSETNFICLQVENAQEFVKQLAEKNIIIRDRSNAIANSVNIAVGTKTQNDFLLDVVSKI